MRCPTTPRSPAPRSVFALSGATTDRVRAGRVRAGRVQAALVTIALAAIVSAPLACGVDDRTDPPVTGRWRAWLESPGGELPFGLVIDADGLARIENGKESIPVPRTERTSDGGVVLEFPHYDSRIEAALEDGSLVGTWRKRRGADAWTEMVFRAEPAEPGEPEFAGPGGAEPSAARFAGRWRIDFESSDDPAIGIFEASATPGEEDVLLGTILTTTGDYRYLSGNAIDDRIRLSCFDGAHAFLFHARQPLPPLDFGYSVPSDPLPVFLRGEFWSRESWHETWTAARDEGIELPDAYEQTRWTADVALGDVVFPDLEGTPRSLADPEFAGKARILQIFGSWCPNCHDASELMAELDRDYRERGLSIVGLAFELTGDFERDAEQVRRYRERHGVRYPTLVAGLADKEKATETLGLLDQVRSYPTTIFLREDGSVRAIHSGFTGPATGEPYRELVAEFRSILEELLGDA